MIDRDTDWPRAIEDTAFSPPTAAEIYKVLTDAQIDNRPLYAATPLNASKLREAGGDSYFQRAREQIDRTFGNNLVQLDTLPSSAVIRLMDTSINNALFRQVAENEGKTVPLDCSEEEALLFQAACSGNASIKDLITLFQRYPRHLQTVELAKQTHPFSWTGTELMHTLVHEALYDSGFLQLDKSTARYYFMCADVESSKPSEPGALMLVREIDVGRKYNMDNSEMIATQSDTLVLDVSGDEMAHIRQEVLDYQASQQEETGDLALEEWYGGSKYPFVCSATNAFIDSVYQAPVAERSPALYPGVGSYSLAYSGIKSKV